MANRVFLALVKSLILTFLLATSYEYEKQITFKSNAVKKQKSNDLSFPQVDQTPNGPYKHEIPQAELFGSVTISRTRKNNGKLGYYANNKIMDRIRERHVKGEASVSSFARRNSGNIYQKARRVKRDAQRENQNGTDQSVVCEVSSLSCRNCCEGSTGNCSHKTIFCRCDPQCTFYNDCCVDYETFCGKQRQISFGVDRKGLLCKKPKNVDLRSSPVIRLWMVNKCPNDRKIDEISQNCETAEMVAFNITNLRKLIPVIDVNNITFRNEFCAKCNGIEDFEYFGFEMNCYVAPPASIRSLAELTEFASKYCGTKKSLSIFRQANQPIRECNQYFRDVCPTLIEADKNCNRQDFSFFSESCIVKYHWCNLKQGEWGGDLPWQCGTESSIITIPDVPPLTIALRLSKQGPISKVQDSECGFREQFFDPYLETCRAGQLISLPTTKNFDKFDVAVWFDMKEIFLDMLITGHPYLNDFISSLAQLFNFNRSQVTALQDIQTSYELWPKYKVIRFELQLTSEHTLRLGKDSYTNNATVHFGNKSGISKNVLPLWRLLFFSGKFNVTVGGKVNRTLTVFKTTSHQLVCIRKQTYPKGAYISVQYGEYYYINSTGKTFAKREVFFEGETNDSISVCELVVFAGCVGRRVNLTSDEYVKFDNLSIFYNRTQMMYDFGEYDIEDGQIFMCISKVTPKINSPGDKWIPSDSLVVESYLTLTCFILSLTCLFLVILTYLLFPELRNLPGKNVLSLSISLFMVQLLWLIPDKLYPSTLCHIIAVIKHYLFLVSFVVMATIAWDTCSVFAGGRLRNDLSTKNREKKKFYKYSAITWGLSALFVVTCAVVDQKGIYAVYVNELLCWFDNIEAQEYLFVLPVGLLLLFNVSFFTLTVFRIQRARTATRLVRADQDNRRMFWIYLKLSSLMGFCWLFGFICLLVESPVFSYLFVIFASLQGVYIALAFVMKRDVWEKYKLLFRRKDTGHSADHQSTLIDKLSLSKETKV